MPSEPSPEAVLREHYPELDDAQMERLLADDLTCTLARLHADGPDVDRALAARVQDLLAREAVE